MMYKIMCCCIAAVTLFLQPLSAQKCFFDILQHNGLTQPARSNFLFYGADVHLKHELADIYTFSLTPDDPNVPRGAATQGVVNFTQTILAVGSTLITDHKTIKKIVSTFTLLDQVYASENLFAYAGKLTKDSLQEVIFVDNQHRYAIRGGALLGSNPTNPVIAFNLTWTASDANIHDDWAAFLLGVQKKSSGFLQGDPNAPKTVYAMGGPADPYTNSFYNQILPYVESGEVKVYWVLGSFAYWPQSRWQVFAIYDGKVPDGAPYPHTPQGAWAYNQDNYDPVNQVGAILPLVNAPHKIIKRANKSATAYEIYNYDFLLLSYRAADGVPDYIIDVVPDINAFVDNLYSH